MENKIKDGDIVRIKREWCDYPEERKYLFVVKNLNEELQRCLIVCLNPGNSLGYSQNVDLSMLDSANFNSLEAY